jgi:hypothetical protein
LLTVANRARPARVSPSIRPIEAGHRPSFPLGWAGEAKRLPVRLEALNKSHILAEIRRTAATNGGTALGHARFRQETGIKVADWHGKFWSRWGDALTEAGFTPNALQAAFPDDVLFERLVGLCRELGRVPTFGEMKLKHRADPTFPNAKVFQRFGTKRDLVSKLAAYCRTRGDLGDVLALCEPTASPSSTAPVTDDIPEPDMGFVYLFKSGRYYKIGRSNAAGRREREVALQLPERTTAVHTIRTDDPSGIEAYWHSRFEEKRLNGEWFNLTAADVSAFKRRKFM